MHIAFGYFAVEVEDVQADGRSHHKPKLFCAMEHVPIPPCTPLAILRSCVFAGVEDVQVVSDDGSPHGPKCFVLWNPPLTVSQKALDKGSQAKLSRTEGRARLTKAGPTKYADFPLLLASCYHSAVLISPVPAN